MHIISGGESGVPTCACDFAKKYQIPMGGYCIPSGLNQDSIDVSIKYNLTKLPDHLMEVSFGLRSVVVYNVKCSSHLLVLHTSETPYREDDFLRNLLGPLGMNGSIAWNVAFENNKESLSLNLNDPFCEIAERFIDWVSWGHVDSLCVSGPSEDEIQSIYNSSMLFFERMIEEHPEFMKDEFSAIIPENSPKYELPLLGGKQKKPSIPKEPMLIKESHEEVIEERPQPKTPTSTDFPVLGGKQKKKNLYFDR